MSIDPIEIKIRIVNSIIEEWEGFSAQILSYHGHHGIGGFLLILLSSPQGRYFAIQCGACIKNRTKFNWNVRSLRLDYSIEHHQIYLKDDTGFYSIPRDYIHFYELLNTDLIKKIAERKAKSKNLSLLEQFDIKESFIYSGQDTRDCCVDVSNFKFNSTGGFHGIENILHFMAFHEDLGKPEIAAKSWWQLFLPFITVDPAPQNEKISHIVIKNPTYYHFPSDSRWKIELDVRVENSNIVKFFDNANGDLIIEAEDAAIIDNRLYYSSESISDESFIPDFGLYHLMFKEIIQIDVRS
jgi:hypothetical protein